MSGYILDHPLNFPDQFLHTFQTGRFLVLSNERRPNPHSSPANSRSTSPPRSRLRGASSLTFQKIPSRAFCGVRQPCCRFRDCARPRGKSTESTVTSARPVLLGRRFSPALCVMMDFARRRNDTTKPGFGTGRTRPLVAALQARWTNHERHRSG